jgi:DNA mismatch repair protein MutS
MERAYSERSMTSHSVLYESDVDRANDGYEQPDHLHDLHVDRIVESVTAGYEAYDLGGFFRAPLSSTAAIEYRHEVMRDLEDDRIFAAVRSFGDSMRRMHEHMQLSERMQHHYQKRRWFLHALETYGLAVSGLAASLGQVEPKSRALRSLREYLVAYAGSDAFAALQRGSTKLAGELSDVRYTIFVKGNRVTVDRFAGEIDFSTDVGETFRTFVERTAKEYRFDVLDEPEMNHVEAKILDAVVSLHPEVFTRLEQFCVAHEAFRDPVVMRFEREIQFYLAYLSSMRRLETFGLNFSYPEVADGDRSTFADECFDLALAVQPGNDPREVACNSFHLDAAERIVILTGPHRSGKTTFARAFGQLHHFTALGLPVPGKRARVALCDGIFTYFDEGVEPSDGSVKLRDQLFWSRDVLRKAGERSVIILKELFGSPGTKDTAVLARRIVERIGDIGALCLYVTYLDELATLNDKTVGMVCVVSDGDAAARRYDIKRGPVQGPPRAMTLATKYDLTYDRVKARIPS